MQITITRALAELKLLASRIENETYSGKFITAYKKSSKKVNGVKTVAEFETAAKAYYDSIKSLIERHRVIKSAIVASNANINVTIAGKQMTVAEAIERKSSIGFEKTLLAMLESQLSSAQAAYNNENSRMESNLDTFLNNTLGKDGRSKVTKEELEAISKPYRELNEWVVSDVLHLEEVTRQMRKDISEFESEVDFVLSESNSITKIEIAD